MAWHGSPFGAVLVYMIGRQDEMDLFSMWWIWIGCCVGCGYEVDDVEGCLALQLG